MRTSPPTLSSRMARHRSCKKKRPSSASQDADSSPELTTAPAKRTKRSSPAEKKLTSERLPSRSVSSRPGSSSPEATEVPRGVPTPKKSVLPCADNKTPKKKDAVSGSEVTEMSPNIATLGNSQPFEQSGVEELPQRSSRRWSGRVPLAVVNGDVNADRSVIGTEESTPAATIRRSPPHEVKNSGRNIELVIDDEVPLDATFVHRDTWTLKYAPSTYGTFVGNPTAVEELDVWLREWQDPARNMKFEVNSYPGQSVQQEQAVSNALLIRGPPGVGKTALVYHLAHRLGYMVLEVNSSSERPGRRILADLQEATQSGHVHGTKVSAGNSITSFFKPTLGSVQSSPSGSTTPTSTAGASRRKVGKGKKAPVVPQKGSLQNFFSPKNSPSNKPTTDNTKEDGSPEVKTVISEAKSSIKSFFKSDKKPIASPSSTIELPCARLSLSPVIETGKAGDSKMESQKIKVSRNTIILFDDVDVIFEDDGDEGFWMALETVVRNSKKPCILTVTQGYDSVVKRSRILQNAPLIDLHRPAPTEVAALVKRVCESEQRDLTDYNVDFMCQYLASDVRRSLLQMEFETVSSGLTQTVYPANKTIGGLLGSGYIDDALAVQMTYKKVGFNALYASLEDCLPFNCDDDKAAGADKTSFATPNGTRTLDEGSTLNRKSFEISTLRDLSAIFDELSACDLFTGTLDKMGQEYLPSYERAKRWMARQPMEGHNSNARSVEELLEIEASVLLKKAVTPINRISEKFAALKSTEQEVLRFPRSVGTSGFHNIHSQLEKVRTRETALEDVLNVVPILRPLARDYLAYLVRICEAEESRRKMPRRSANRFVHYLSQSGMFHGTEKIQRIANFWQKDEDDQPTAVTVHR